MTSKLDCHALVIRMAGSGVGRSGDADRRALWLADRLVANPEDAAGIEVAPGVTRPMITTRERRAVTIAVTRSRASIMPTRRPA